jgi:hypothetical protein
MKSKLVYVQRERGAGWTIRTDLDPDGIRTGNRVADGFRLG